MISAILDTMENKEDKSKLEYLYDKFGRKLLYEALYILKNKEDAEDATHDAFVNIARVIDTIDITDDARCLSYMLTAVKNAAYKIAAKRYPKNESADDDLTGELENADASPEDILITKETYSAAVEAIKELDEKYRDVLYYKIFEEMSDKDIALLLGLNYSTVRIRIKRGRKILSDKLKERGAL